MGIIELIFEMSLSDCPGQSAVIQLHSCYPACPLHSKQQFHPNLSLWKLLKRKKYKVWYLPEPICEIAWTVKN
jgi:hypothetical protein